MKQVLMTGAMLLTLTSAGFAQTTPTRPAANPPVSSTPSRMESTANTSSSAVIATVPPQGELSSNVVGLDVYNSANKSIGKIKDIAFDSSGVKAYILSVGGAMGVGSKYVAVQPSAVKVAYDANAKKWHASMNADEAQLKSAPEFKYSSND